VVGRELGRAVVSWWRLHSASRGKRGDGAKTWPRFQMAASKYGLETYMVRGSKPKWDSLAVKWIPRESVDQVYELFRAVQREKAVEPITVTFEIRSVEDIDAAIKKLEELRQTMVKLPARVSGVLRTVNP